MNGTFILPMTNDHLPVQAHPGPDESVLAVTVRGLIEIHEVHVDFLIGDFDIVLSGKMAIRLL